jgi:hypothetical protein
MTAVSNRAPNLFELHGDHIAVTYATTSIDGKPRLTYQDTHRTLTFEGDQIQSVDAGIGRLETVTLSSAPDQGSTTFTLLVPDVNLGRTDSAPVTTEGVITLHRTSIAPQVLHGQTELYRVHRLIGTARAVEF